MSDFNNKLAQLSDEKKQLLLKHIKSNLEKAKGKIVPQPRTKNNFMLSLRQQRLFILDQLDVGNPFYNIPASINFNGNLQIEKLEQAINKIVEKHFTLRTRFSVNEDGSPCQIVYEHQPITLKVIDCTKNVNSISDKIKEIVQTSFNIMHGPLWTIALLKRSEHEHQLIVSFHHILFDGWSLEIFINELCTLYKSYAQGTTSDINPLPLQYVDYAEWELKHFDESMRKRQLDYWQKELEGHSHIVALPTDKLRPKKQSYKGKLYTINLPQTIHLKLRELCKTYDTTLFMITLAAFQTIISKYSNQDDVIVGFPISCRDQEELESIIGLFVNTLPLRANFANNPTFIEHLTTVKQKSLEAFNNKHIPFDQIVEYIQPARDLSFNPIFQVLFSYQSAILPTELDGLTVQFENVDPGTSKFDLSLDIFEGSESIPPQLVFEYNTDLFYEETIIHFAQHYINLLHQIANNPQQRIGEMSLLSAEEQKQKASIRLNTSYNIKTDIMSLFEKQALEANHQVAITYKDQSMTYKELNERANKLARLLQARGAKSGDRIGICLDKCLDMVVSVLAVLKIGATYIPIDPHYPHSRVKFMIEDSTLTYMITHNNPLAEQSNIEAIMLSNIEEMISPLPQHNLNVVIDPEQLAYIIYTSGTTGNPKGVMVSHSNLVNAYYGWEEAYQLTSKTSNHLQMASFSFDVCTGDIVRALLSGKRLVLCDKENLIDPERLYRLINDEHIDFAEFIPAVFRQLAHYLKDNRLTLAMNCVVLGSDTWYMNEYEDYLNLLSKNTRLINSYGLTEDTIDSSYFEWEKQDLTGKTVPIGRPLLNKQLIILDKYKNIVPTGVIGEIYIAGKGITKGYLNRPELTKERFIVNRFDEDDSLLYKTGDLGRYLNDGNVELIGRADDQVKILGFRIELNEVNTILLNHPAILNSIVVDVQSGENKQLVAYYVSEKQLDSDDIKQYMRQQLPEFMIPAQLVELEAMPLNANRKIDRSALPKVDFVEGSITNYIVARTLTESIVQNIWAEAFQRQHISIYDNFFEIGGHSLLAIQLMNRIQEAFSIQLSIQALFQSPTIEQLSKEIENAKGNLKAALLEIPIVEPNLEDRYLPFPLTDIQQAYWVGRNDVFEFGNISTHSYDEMKAEQLDIKQFEYAWNKLIERHDMLRAVINEDGTQQILREVPHYEIKVYNMKRANAIECETMLKHIRDEMAHQLLPAKTWPTFDIRITELPDQYRIHFSTDALFWDAWSFVTLIKELVMIYQNQERSLKPLAFSFRDYVLAEQQIKNSKAYKKAKLYWKNKVKHLPPAPELPMIKNPAAIKTPTFTRLHNIVDQQTWSRLKRKTTKNGLTPTALLLSIYAEVLSTFSKSPSFSINLTFLNRHHVHAQVNEVVGEFTSVMLLSVNNQNHTTFMERAKQIQLDLWNDIEHNFVSGVEILRELTRNNGAATQAKMPVVFTSALVVPVPDQEETPIPFHLVGEDGVTQTSQVWLDCGVWEDTKRLLCNWDVVLDLYPEGFIQDMFSAYCNLIVELANSDSLWNEKVLPVLPTEQLLQKEAINATEGKVSNFCLHSFINVQLNKRPHKTFIQTTSRTLSFFEVNEKANRISQWLVKRGAGRNNLVAVVMDKGWEQVVAVLAILKANAAYVPINPSLPPDRLNYMLQHSDVELILTQSTVCKVLSHIDNIEALCVDDELSYANYINEEPQQIVNKHDLAYVIFTSGSTGTPKGVMIDHAGAVNTIIDVNKRFNITEQDNILALSNLNFDLSVFDIFGALQAGSTIVIPDEKRLLDPLHWLDLINIYDVTVWSSVPQLMSLLSEAAYSSLSHISACLRLVMLSGDWIPLTLPHQIKEVAENNDIEIISLGGATEASIWSIYYPIHEVNSNWKSIPYGKPLQNQKMYVLNHQYEYCPTHVTGDIYIGGMGLALGYWKDEEKTNKSFIFHPSTGERLYRTGDLGRYMLDGNIEFLGREDSQVKVQGYRIELGEIESVISLYPGVKQAVCIVRELGNGNKAIVAFYVADTNTTEEQIRGYLETQLPAYMIPSQFIALEEMQLSANGKIDRNALLKQLEYVTETVKAFVKPETVEEKQLAKLWANLLEVDLACIGVDSNFFELGGDSMQAIRMITEAQKQFSHTITLRDFYKSPSIGGLVKLLLQKHTVTLNSEVLHEK